MLMKILGENSRNKTVSEDAGADTDKYFFV